MDFIVTDLSAPHHKAKTNVEHDSLPSPARGRMTKAISGYCVSTDLSCRRTKAAECPKSEESVVGRGGQHVLTGLQNVEGKLKSHDDDDDDALASFCLAVSQIFVFFPICLLDLQNSSTEKQLPMFVVQMV